MSKFAACSRRRIASCLMVALSAWVCLAATAADVRQVVGVSVKSLPLFGHPGESTPVKSVTPEGLPWVILEEKADFFRVKIGDRDFWVDSMHVRATRSAKARCTVVKGDRPAPVGATPGAGENTCLKKP